jgi:hypothetical protein
MRLGPLEAMTVSVCVEVSRRLLAGFAWDDEGAGSALTSLTKEGFLHG